jgi:hypothetical protein
MKAHVTIFTVVFLTILAVSAGAARDLTDAEYARALGLVMDGSRADALAHLDALADTCAGQPLYLLARARVMIEAIPLSDDDKTLTVAMSEPILADLDRVITFCDARLDQEDDPRFRYYRGWAWMVKSHVKALGRNFYGAGRDAGKGKGDLEAYLEYHPGEPIPNGLIGAYLYFTDAVPKLFQFLSKLLFLPTGDRFRGLDMIALAVATDSPARIDYEVLDANVTFFFEGRLEEGLTKSNQLLERHPNYPRLAMASVVAAPLDPFRAADHIERVNEVLGRLDGVADLDSTSLEALRVMQGLALRMVVGHQPALDHFRPIAADPPPHPDWAGAFARLQMAQILASEGRYEEARTFTWQVLNDKSGERCHDQARLLMNTFAEGLTGPGDPVEDAWVTALYSGDPDSLAVLTPRLDALASTSPRAAFYAAECRLLAGDRRGALKGFRAVHAREVPAWDRPYLLLASARVGEIQAARGHWRGAANWLGRAAEEHQGLFRMEWMMQGRQRYFEELDKNADAWPSPTLLSVAP